jgi:hypothetical protein
MTCSTTREMRTLRTGQGQPAKPAHYGPVATRCAGINLLAIGRVREPREKREEMIRKVLGLLAFLGLLVPLATACDFTVDTTSTGSVTTTTGGPVGNPPPVTIPGDEGLDVVYDVVDPDDADAATEVESGVYTSPGALSGQTCKFVQTRELTVAAGDVRAEVAVSDADLDADQTTTEEPAATVVEPDSSGDLTVTLLTGDTFASDGCEDWVKTDDAPEPTATTSATTTEESG